MEFKDNQWQITGHNSESILSATGSGDQYGDGHRPPESTTWTLVYADSSQPSETHQLAIVCSGKFKG